MILLTAHGTRDPAGAVVTERLAAMVRARGCGVRVAYADVRAPDVTTALRGMRGPAVVVPAFLAAGYHVRTDIPDQVAAGGHRAVTIAEPFGPAPELLDVVHQRLLAAGYRRGDEIVLAAAGSSDHRALSAVDIAVQALAERLAAPVRVGYAATARPSVAEAVAAAAATGRRVAVASWLLAPGLFQRKLERAGAEVVADPLGAHPNVADLVLRRYVEASRSAHAA
ncbi:sirohydrochlorin chelatase [Amycolatopsis cihanbeyliensis]|uniref:Sirohydrochlorin ferrochelatase n=1 Tax=Amycolatopsis cihanbeyliensis TaxID=1128664 RepID=A0A542DPK1_AMYCI|nr:sirohydrochlorin chelatase [Amycolatopsis cihanbeyliensis]TQJ04895.1 sirohydrochlorin ferrochelatase [Amycolatopsis cihanbeyliensis]